MIAQPIRLRLLLVCIILATSGCSWDDAVEIPATRPVPAAANVSPDPAGLAARIALKQAGTPYRYGGNSPAGFDCSGLVQYAYGRAGRATPRTTHELFRATDAVSRQALRAGDLVFFEIDGKMAHVGIYLDDDRFVHAPRSGRSVSVESLDSGFYRDRFVRGGRFR